MWKSWLRACVYTSLCGVVGKGRKRKIDQGFRHMSSKSEKGMPRFDLLRKLIGIV